jgi:NRDE-2, necessary for RNA interference
LNLLSPCRSTAAADLLAAADALCPSSSEEDVALSSESEASEEKEEGEVVVGQKRKVGNKAGSDEKHVKKQKTKHSKHKGKSKREKQKSDKDAKKERRRREKKAEAEFAKQVAAELAGGEASRKSTLPHSTTFGKQQQQHEHVVYYCEKRPDPGNIAFGKLYRFDVPRYVRYDPTGYIGYLMRVGDSKGGGKYDEKGGIGSFGRKIEKEKGRKKVTMWWRPRRLASGSLFKKKEAAFLTAGLEYVPLGPSKDKEINSLVPAIKAAAEEESEKETSPTKKEEEEEEEVVFFSPEEYLREKTRNFNAALRQNPENLQLWLDFSAFQDEAMQISSSSSSSSLGGNTKVRGAARATAEKQISILERGLEHHPGSDVLLLALLDAASKICVSEEMERRWQRALAYCPGSVNLWKAYLMKKKQNFANFKVGEVAAAHFQALSALKKEKSRLLSLLSSTFEEKEVEKLNFQLAELENFLVEILLLVISFHLQTGYTELGIAAVRAVLEFNWFAPDGWPEDALEMMFEEFYNNLLESVGGGLKIIGDAGAVGWGAWIFGEDSLKQEVENDDEEEPVGWVEVAPRKEIKQIEDQIKAKDDNRGGQASSLVSPWEELAPAIRARFGHALKTGEHEDQSQDLAEEEEEEEEEEEKKEESEEETEEQLLARLGMDLDEALADAEEELTPEVLSIWLGIECQRDSEQWEASRDNGDEKILENNKAEPDENLFCQVTWDDLAPHLIFIQNKQARENLLTGCLQLLGVSLAASGAPLRNCCSLAENEDEISVAASWLGIGGKSLEAVDSSASIAAGIDANDDGSQWAWLNGRGGHALRDMPWWAVTKERHNFVVNILITLMRNESLKYNYDLAFATLKLASWSIFPSFPQEKEQEHDQASRKVLPARDWAAGRALAKQLLSEQRDNLVLYAAFAALEKFSGRAKAAKKVYSACLSGFQMLLGEDRAVPAGLVELVLGLSQLELESGVPHDNKEHNLTSFFPVSMLSLLRATPQAIHAAARPLLFLGSQGKISILETNSITQEEIVVARRGYQDAVLRVLRVGPLIIDAQEAVAQVSIAAAAELIFAACSCSSNNVGGGVTAALALYKQVIDAISTPFSSSSSSSTFLEKIEIQRCVLAVDAAVRAVHVVPPTLAREIVYNALQRYPSSPALLRMLRLLEVNAHALTTLRRHLNSILLTAPSVPAWLMLAGVEIGANAARTAIRAALLRAVSSHSSSGMHSPLLWRCSLRFERVFGTPDSLHRTFLRAVEACPWSKALWCDGLELLNGYSSPKELSEYLSIMKDKEIAVRTDVLEAVLARLNLQ